jgi:hypothetical protein
LLRPHSFSLGSVVVWNRPESPQQLQAFTLQHWVRGQLQAQQWFSEPKFTYTIKLATGAGLII